MLYICSNTSSSTVKLLQVTNNVTYTKNAGHFLYRRMADCERNVICLQYLSLNNLPRVSTGDSYLAVHKSLASDRLGD
jgi:hypothetical protein